MTVATTGRTRHLAGIAGWVLLLVTALVVATAFDDPRLATPSWGDPLAWRTWLATSEVVFVTAAIVRIVLIAITWYLLGATTILLVARLTDSLAMVRVAEALAVPVVRRVVAAGLGMGLAASVVTGTSARVGESADVRAAGGPVSVAGPVDGQESPSMWPAARNVPATAPPEMLLLRDPPGQPAARTRATDRAPAGPTMRVATDDVHDDHEAPDGAAGATTWTVRSGDHLWHIADRTMAEHLGRPATEQEVAEYWRRLVAHNRPRLPDPDNPDLVLPGLVVQLVDPFGAA